MLPADATTPDEHLLAKAPSSERYRDRQLRICGLLFFLAGFSGSAFGRFGTLFYLDRHLTAGQIGAVEAIQPVLGAAGSQLFGWIADRLLRKKGVAVFGRVVSTAILLLLPACTGCDRCFVSITATLGAVAFFAVDYGVLGAYTLDLLGDDRQHEFGRYRVWCALSWGVGNAMMGKLAEIDFNLNFIAFGALSVVASALMVWALPKRTKGELALLEERRAAAARCGGGEAAGEAEAGGPGRGPGEAGADGGSGSCSSGNGSGGGGGAKPVAGFAASLCTGRGLFFLLELLLLGVGMSLVEQLLFVRRRHHRHHRPRAPCRALRLCPLTPHAIEHRPVRLAAPLTLFRSCLRITTTSYRPLPLSWQVYAVRELGASYSLCGYTVAINVVLELPIFWAGGWLLRNLRHDAMLLGALLAYALRVYGYTLLTRETVTWLLPLEAMHGLTVALAITACTDYMKVLVSRRRPWPLASRAPPLLSTRTPVRARSLSPSLIWCVASPISLFEQVPPQWLTSGQMLMSTVQNSLGRIVGCSFGGWFIMHGTFLGEAGGRGLYLLAACVGGALFALHLSLHVALLCAGKRGLLVEPLPPRQAEMGTAREEAPAESTSST